ncbi:MAG TPA: ribosome-binding factor A [Candidatus Azoamicus sp.]
MADIIVRDYSKNNIISITSVNIDFDFASTRVFVSAFKNTDDIVKFLNFSSKKIKHILSCKIKVLKLPDLIFIDDSKYKIFY